MRRAALPAFSHGSGGLLSQGVFHIPNTLFRKRDTPLNVQFDFIEKHFFSWIDAQVHTGSDEVRQCFGSGSGRKSSISVLLQAWRNKATRQVHSEPRKNTHIHPPLTRINCIASRCLSTYESLHLTEIRPVLDGRRPRACQFATENVLLLIVCARVL